MEKHQVMVFVGNGFDISVLKKYGKGVTTSYSRFYDFYKYKYPESNNNSLILQMEEARSNDKENWSDFEALLTEKLYEIKDEDEDKIKELNKDLEEIQKAFSRFLNEVVDSDILENISAVTEPVSESNKSLASYSITNFLGDLSKEQYIENKFQNRVVNHDELNIIFINFNYTALFDNYIYLDKASFDPCKFKTSNNNFIFNSNPKNYPGHKNFSNPFCKLLTEIHHPHGYQDIPKSLLFGTESIDQEEISSYGSKKIFIKSYWAQSELKYSDYFKESNLFIIYGCSMGASDSWWWKRIYDRLNQNEAELIIYNFGRENETEIKQRFIKNCCLDSSEDTKEIEKRIFVINFGVEGSKEIVFLQLSEA